MSRFLATHDHWFVIGVGGNSPCLNVIVSFIYNSRWTSFFLLGFMAMVICHSTTMHKRSSPSDSDALHNFKSATNSHTTVRSWNRMRF
mmetsp:Transcript_24084/g.50813  ORF Transcript_24084/g.50813 Transcript_24084/m.50813 type:complete len:88 (-) Transcript_24084:2917-3180(-)